MDLGTVKPALQNLPPEIKRTIVGFLNTQDTVNIRLVSRNWAILGAQLFFHNGIILHPTVKSADRLDDASKHTVISTSITCVTVELNDNCGFLTICRGNQELLVRERDPIRVQDAFSARLKSHWKEKLLNEYELSQIFRRLPGLRSLKIDETLHLAEDSRPALNDYSPNPELELVKNNLDLGQTVWRLWRYNVILSATQKAQLPLRHLELQSLPVFFFVKRVILTSGQSDTIGIQNDPDQFYDQEMVALLKRSISTLTDLWLAVDWRLIASGSTPSPPASLNIFDAMVGLRSLDLDWAWTDDPNQNFEAGMQKYFLDTQFPHLERLRLQRTRIRDVALDAFLKTHSSTLKCLHINSSAVFHGQWTFREFFTRLRTDLSLRKFQYVPVLQTGAQLPIYDRSWNCLRGSDKAYTTPLRPEDDTALPYGGYISDGELLEMFVLGKCKWPMQRDSPETMLLEPLPGSRMFNYYHGWWRCPSTEICLEMEDDTERQAVSAALLRDETPTGS